MLDRQSANYTKHQIQKNGEHGKRNYNFDVSANESSVDEKTM